MYLRRDPIKALQIGFFALLLISIAQVAWWITADITYTRNVHDQFVELYEADALIVTAFYANDAETWEALLPHLDISAETNTASVNADVAAVLDNETSSRINRVIWEGGFFLLVLLGGLTVLTRTIRHDAELRARQQNFLAAVSHEFKSPLASMRLSTETLLLRVSDPDTQRLGRRLLDDGERLLRMVDNLLDTTRVEEGRMELAPEDLQLRGVAESCVEEFADRARHNNIEIQIDVPADLRIEADRTTLETVLRNLLDNAVKACIAGHGNAIRLHAARAGSRVEFSVADDGLGFPPEDAAMIFEKFYRLGDELRRSTPGTGLGLYIVRRLVELSNARITAESEGPGKGATLTVSWPGTRSS
ncbi:MAG: HAMP domain-containing histidine kinase [Acidobacteria bacterium]|nr:MAG: HAMP domain-containing histidine kinase [Acidobacteriota bacterium]